MSPDRPRVFAIVPAAGRSRRMGTPKQLLDVGGRTMLAAVLEPLAAAQVLDSKPERLPECVGR